MRVVTVLRTGGEYTSEHARAMQRQVAKWAPRAQFECLSDVEILGIKTTPLRHNWPGWWNKIEMFRPDFPGGFLYTDLDNVIVGSLMDLPQKKFTLNGPPRIFNTGFMYVPEEVRAEIWENWMTNPAGHVAAAIPTGDGHTGDEIFLKPFAQRLAAKWDDTAPGAVIFGQPIIDRKTPTLNLWRPTTEKVVVCSTPDGRPWKHAVFRRYYFV